MFPGPTHRILGPEFEGRLSWEVVVRDTGTCLEDGTDPE